MNTLVAAAVMKIAVLQLAATNVDRSLADNLSDVLLTTVQARPGYAAIGKADIDAMVGFETQRQLLGCDEAPSCLAELGGALGVTKIVSGSIGRIDDDYLLTLRIVDIQKGRVDASATETVSGKASQLVAVIRRLVPELFARMEGGAPPPAATTTSPTPPPSPPSPTRTDTTPPPPLPSAALQPTAPAPPGDAPRLVGWIGAGVGVVGLALAGAGFAQREGAMGTYRTSIVASELTQARLDAAGGQGLLVTGLVVAGVGAVAAALGFTVF